MSEFSLELQAFAGSGIDACATEAIRLANKLGITVTFWFNGVRCIACVRDDPASLAAEWHRVSNSDSQRKIARAKVPSAIPYTEHE